MKKRYILIILIVFLILEIIFSVFTTCFADIDTSGISIKRITSGPLVTAGNKAIGLIRYIAVFVAVGATMILGFKYMTGSITEQAKYKEWTILFVIGIILVFGITGIVKMVYNLLN